MGAESVVVNPQIKRIGEIMEMLLLLGLCILTFAFIDRQHAVMRRVLKARIEDNERRHR